MNKRKKNNIPKSNDGWNVCIFTKPTGCATIRRNIHKCWCSLAYVDYVPTTKDVRSPYNTYAYSDMVRINSTFALFDVSMEGFFLCLSFHSFLFFNLFVRFAFGGSASTYKNDVAACRFFFGYTFSRKLLRSYCFLRQVREFTAQSVWERRKKNPKRRRRRRRSVRKYKMCVFRW